MHVYNYSIFYVVFFCLNWVAYFFIYEKISLHLFILFFRLFMDKSDWNSKAANLIKAELKLAGIGYEELVLRLAGIGVQETYKGIASKINRGTFSFVFFMQCMKALNIYKIRL